MTGLEFPNISPIFFSIGPLAIRWYSLAYLVGIVAGWFVVTKYVKKYSLKITQEQIEDLAFYVVLGVVLGGRLGYTIFYGGANNPFFQNPLRILEIWKGGMSFHGGIAGVIIAVLLYARKSKIKFFELTDLIALTAPFGIFLGRIANFINDELWGRVTDVSWAVRFPNGGYLPRHPSQLYEAFLEGLVILFVLNFLWRYKWIRERAGFISALFAVMYASFRAVAELFREPDAQIGFLFANMTMGQLLSIPLVIAGLYVIGKNLVLKKN